MKLNKKNNLTFLIGILFILPALTESAEILMVFNAVSKSHYILGEALGIALADNGHKVTMVSPFKRAENHTNYKEIVLEGLIEKSLSAMYNFETSELSALGMINYIFDLRNKFAELTMEHPEIQKLVNSNQKFDLFITEFNLNECIFGLGYHFKTINIVFSTIGSNYFTDEMVGLLKSPAQEPNIILGYSLPMSYMQRVVNTLFHIAFDYLDRSRLKHQELLFEQYFRPSSDGSQLPTLKDLYRNFSLILLNNNVAVSKPTAQFPNMINVGGLHIKLQKLPKDLQKIMDQSTEGVLLFSMGGNLKSSKIPKDILNVILKCLGKIKQTVLWKWEDEHLPNKPENVIIRKWLPQQDILAHNNTVAFITHGGMLSKIEAIYFGVPLLGIPVLGDQFMNVADAVHDGIAVSVDINKLNELLFDEALNNILNNSSYGQRARELSAIFRDSPETPLQRAVNSIEFILRHKGAPFLRPPVKDMPMYQVLLLDVFSGVIFIFIVIVCLIYYIIKTISITKKIVNIKRIGKSKKMS